MARWREARDGRRELPPEEQAELEELTRAEVEATAHRAAARLR
jgi:hypothetical protein